MTDYKWKWAYALEMKRLTKIPWTIAWDYACISLSELDYDLTEDPKNAVAEEMNCWGD
jgi:hypothetical protein